MGSETRWSPEPWSVIPGHVTDGVADADGAICAEGWPGARPRDDGEANARRIVACVNACAGLDSGGLETGSLADALQALAVLVDEEEPAACRRLAFGQARHALRALGRLP